MDENPISIIKKGILMSNNEFRIILVDEYLKSNLSETLKEYFKGRNILITGGAGAIGSNLVIAIKIGW